MDPTTRRHDGSHGDDCFGCRIQGVQFDPRATPSRRNDVEPKRKDSNAYERGIMRDHRGLPIRIGGEVVGIKQYQNNRRKIDAGIRDLRAGRQPEPISLKTKTRVAG